MDGIDPFALEEPWSELNEETSTMEDHCRWNRDDQGKIVSFDCDWSYANFTWKDGRVSSLMRSHEDLTYKHEFEYDAEGRLVKETLYNGTIDEVENDEMILERVIEYTYLDFDDHGNWTRRKERFTDYEINYEDEEEVTRSIQYYE